MNWGYRLMIVFAGFALLIGTLAYKAMHTRYELVSKDYYSEELKYQDKIDGMNHAAEAGDIMINRTDSTIQLTLPPKLQATVDSTEAWFYCKTDASNDRKLHPHFENNIAIINTADLPPNSYELRLQFVCNGEKYYYVKSIITR